MKSISAQVIRISTVSMWTARSWDADRCHPVPDSRRFLLRTQPSEGTMPSEPPYIGIEVRSVDEGDRSLQAKLDEYKARKIPHIWVIEPRGRKLIVHDGAPVEASSVILAAYGVTITPADIWA